MSRKKEKWDGRSRPSDDNYRKRWNEIFGKKEQEGLKDEEENTREHAPHSSQQEARDE